MIPGALDLQDQYASLKMPVSIIAGDEDRLIDTDTQSHRLHGNIVQSKFHRVPGAGHMVHQTATGSVMAAIGQVSKDIPSEPARKCKCPGTRLIFGIGGDCDQTAVQSAHPGRTDCTSERGGNSDPRCNHNNAALFWSRDHYPDSVGYFAQFRAGASGWTAPTRACPARIGRR